MSKENIKILLIRSAFLGDLLVVIPQLMEFMRIRNLNMDQIDFMILSKGNTNPLEIIFGQDNAIFQQSKFVRNKNIVYYILDIIKVRFVSVTKYNEIYYLNYATENRITKLGKILPFYILWPLTPKAGFKLKKKYSYSQYLSPFKNIIQNYANIGINKIKYSEIFKCEYGQKKEIVINTAQYKILLYPNGKIYSKIWPLKHFVELIWLINTSIKNVAFYLIGAEEDKLYNEELIKQLKINPYDKIFNIAGTLTVKETFELLRNSSLLITNDGFPMHLACLAECPTLALFTYREDIGSWEPIYNPNFVSIRTHVSCYVCEKVYCDNSQCLKRTLPSDIIEYIYSLLKRVGVRKSVVLFNNNLDLSFRSENLS